MNVQLLTRRLRAVWSLALTNGPERKVSKRWLVRNPGKLERAFRDAHPYSVRQWGEYLRFDVGEEIFLWPANARQETMVQLLAELLVTTHPHQYNWGPTQVARHDVVLDIGACEGSFAALVTGRCSGVIVVEPSRTMCALIRDLFKLREQPCPVIKQCLLGDKPSIAYFLENPVNPGASRASAMIVEGAYEVPVLTLDRLVEELEPKPTFVKCDAEGSAPTILSGGRNFLARCRPKLAIASYHTDWEYIELHNLLKPLGYCITGKGFIFTGSKLRVNMLHAY